jgi:hypothetical protein
MTDFWKRKLAAYLHDPPEKAYDHDEHHKQRAEIHAASFGVADLWRSMGGSPDWSDHAGGKGKGAGLLPYLPADTRIAPFR